jgi:NAD(P)-dependent dehydrogenase (short-subunit alcohol dehydrogenase family)
MSELPHGQALITGALGGLGTAIVKRFLRAECPVVACDRREQLAPIWLEQFTPEQRGQLSFYPLDVTKEELVNDLATALQRQNIPVAYLINNAGINGEGEVWDLESRVWERVLRVNLHGTFYLTRAFSQAMVERSFGRIVNLASLYAYQPGPGEAPYAAAKAGVTGYTRSTALDLAPHGVTVNVLAPGLIWHEGLSGVFPQETFDRMVRKVPLGRAGKPEEIAATVAFLCSEDAAYITGQTLHVNGGWYLPG